MQVIGTTSAAKKLTLTNHGSGTLTINQIYIGGLNPGDFSETKDVRFIPRRRRQLRDLRHLHSNRQKQENGSVGNQRLRSS
jgi:hypothetical protein